MAECFLEFSLLNSVISDRILVWGRAACPYFLLYFYKRQPDGLIA